MLLREVDLALVAVLATVVVKGMQIMSSQFLLTSMRNVDPNSFDGGVYHAIIGTLEQVGIATAIGGIDGYSGRLDHRRLQRSDDSPARARRAA